MIKEISSLTNKLIQHAVKLQQAKQRKESRQFLVEGVRACEEFLHSPYELITLFITPEQANWAIAQQTPEELCRLVPASLMQKMSTCVTPSGVLGIFGHPPITSQPALSGGVVLANLQDPGNVGALIRTATALKKQVVIIDGADPFGPKAVQASAGTLAHCALWQMSFEELRTETRERGIFLSALVVTGGKKEREVVRGRKRFLVVGNEAHGLPPAWAALCDEQVTLDMPGSAESLNAAIAGSIALYIFR
jgi:TrmH family RNA methyltransferase